ncbi:IclR family transcriptional regulator [Natrinema thermotolerans]|uniref:IclR family transcriptional regulator n=1 Tax=Natrinema thermotolerans TaxID=121872 RepID=A0AAF0PEE4_9EURY|nr:IclR family transcriptional regulator [Natrinema thermotolerans]QCC58532.1 IclR family transcriptional regulator [Natrinema thermotolerans]WMT09666.1 IclR family transcriptional regulator [Natrinema thermotolerans]
MTDSQLLTTTETSLAVIEAIQELDGATPAELAAALELSESAVYKHLYTLAKHGYVTSEGDEYRLGARFYHIGMYVRNRSKVYELAGKYVIELAEQSNEESDFGIEENGRIVTLFDSVGSSAKPSSRLNNYEYMHTTAIGKAILARLPESRIDEIDDRWGLPELTEETITSRAELDAELERIRERGYAINDQESIPGKRVAGVVAEGPNGAVIGGFTVSGPAYRIEDADLHQEFPDILQRVVPNFETELVSQGLL